MITQTLANSIARYAHRTLRHPMASDTGVLVASQYAAAGLGFITNIVAARLLGPADYGVAALAMAYPTLLWSFMDAKSVSVATRYIAGFRACGQCEKLKSVAKLGYGLDFVASVVGLMLVCLTAWWVSRHVYHIPELMWIMVAYAGSFPLYSPVGTSQAVLSAWRRFRWLATFQVFEPCVTLILVISSLLAGFGVPGMVVAMALGQATLGLTMLTVVTYMLHREGLGFWWNSSLSQIALLRRELTNFFGWNCLMVTLSGLVGHVPVMLLGHLRGGEAAGFYRLATSLMTVGSYLETSLRQVVYPVLSARWSAGEKEGLDNTLKRWTLRGGVLAAALVLFTIPFLPIAVPIVFGPGYSPIVPGAQTMMVGAAVSTMFFWLYCYYYASGKIEMWTKTYGIYTVLVITGGWFCIRQWGFLGMAVLVTVGKVLFTLLLVKFATHQISGNK